MAKKLYVSKCISSAQIFFKKILVCLFCNDLLFKELWKMYAFSLQIICLTLNGVVLGHRRCLSYDYIALNAVTIKSMFLT